MVKNFLHSKHVIIVVTDKNGPWNAGYSKPSEELGKSKLGRDVIFARNDQ
jgi:hypothetical protein